MASRATRQWRDGFRFGVCGRGAAGSVEFEGDAEYGLDAPRRAVQRQKGATPLAILRCFHYQTFVPREPVNPIYQLGPS